MSPCLLPSASSYVKAMCGSAQKSFTVSKLSSESVAFWLKLSSASVSCRRNLLRRQLEPRGHSVQGLGLRFRVARARRASRCNQCKQRRFIQWMSTWQGDWRPHNVGDDAARTVRRRRLGPGSRVPGLGFRV